MIGFGSALVSGAAVALRRKFSASQFWDDVRKYDASIFVYIGELCRYLLNAPKSPNERNHRLRARRSATACARTSGRPSSVASACR